MKKILASILFFTAVTHVGAADYKVDDKHTNARFAIDHFGTSTNVGGIYGLKGMMQFDAQNQTGSISISLPLANLQSSSDAFTKHLKSPDLFHADKFPEMKFISTQFHFQNNKVSAVDGTLTLLGQTHPVQLKAEKFNCYHNPMFKAQVCGGDFSTTLDRSKWGMNYLLDAGMTKDVHIDIQFEAVKQ
ncbi:MAG: YceI family protein [Alysiella sp.]|uniref:YceI family protein n=1 Tax=Alysiella sp. TaxID=1872483 RepID=UPI0026DCEF73|nr:YceI family protein [Alysiella sp.]MDO4433847.1 YceI family protein [Alysiella sp.]